MVLVIVAALYFIFNLSLAVCEPIVHTKYGDIQGAYQYRAGSAVAVYLGIPYAETRTGVERLRLPTPAGKWKGVKIADKPAGSCYQVLDESRPGFWSTEVWNPRNEISEDCLQLNIWVPQEHNGDVMVWIHGGGYFSGSASLEIYDGGVMAATQGVIVVGINYRLGPFGFLFFGHNSSVPGNMGLADQQLALQWIHENINSFGGHPKQVTIFGESAGAASVSSHLFAPKSEGLFQRAIVMSGSMNNNWASASNKTLFGNSLLLASKVGCPNQPDIEKVIDCVRRVPAAEIQKASDEILTTMEAPVIFPFVPLASDRHFFEGDLRRKLSKRLFTRNVDLLMGSVSDEGTYFLTVFLSPELGFSVNPDIPSNDPRNAALINRKQFEDTISSFIKKYPKADKEALFAAYEKGYPVSANEARLRDGASGFVGDYVIVCDLIEMMDKAVNISQNNVYAYKFTKRSSANTWPKWMGVMHGYELDYFFGMPFLHPEWYNQDDLDNERRFSMKMMNYWSTFAKIGKPADSFERYDGQRRITNIVGDEDGTTTDLRGSSCRILEKSMKKLNLKVIQLEYNDWSRM